MQIIGKHFDKSADFSAYVHALRFNLWRPRFVVVHNTSAPDMKTYAGYVKRGLTDEAWMANLKNYYEHLSPPWQHGPHLFVTPRGINVFSPLTERGTHTPSWNAITWGVETVGEFERDPFTGPVRDNLIAALAILHIAAGLQPRPYVLGSKGLHFHKEDKATTHRTCPGKNMVKDKLVADVEAAIKAMAAGEHAPPPVA